MTNWKWGIFAVAVLQSFFFCLASWGQDSNSFLEDAQNNKREADQYERTYNQYQSDFTDTQRDIAETTSQINGASESALVGLKLRLQQLKDLADTYKDQIQTAKQQMDHYTRLYNTAMEHYKTALAKEQEDVRQKQAKVAAQASAKDGQSSSTQTTSGDTSSAPPANSIVNSASEVSPSPAAYTRLPTTIEFKSADNSPVNVYYANGELAGTTPSELSIDDTTHVRIGTGLMAKDFELDATGGSQTWELSKGNATLYYAGWLVYAADIVYMIAALNSDNPNATTIGVVVGLTIPVGACLNLLNMPSAYRSGKE
jgi:cation transport regulator ChaB